MPVPSDLPPEFFATRMGVYYPNHHAVLAMADGEDATRLREELLRSGFAADALWDASPATMAAFLRRTSEEAGLLAQVVASELKQMEILLQLAESGCRFLIVRLDDDAQKEQLMRVGAAYPIEKGTTLTVTLPAGAGAETVTFQESPDGWIQRYYPAPYAKASVAEYFGEPTWDGNVVTFTTVQRIPKNASFDLRFAATGDQLQGETRAQLTGAWDPLQVVQARDEANAHAVPDCFRPATEERNGNRTDRCEVEWYSDAVLDRRFHDWTNNGFIHKVRSPLQTDGHATADAPGSMEVQHYFTGNDTLRLRIPVGTDSDMGDARFVVDLPEIPGHEWTVEPTGTPFYPVRDYDAVEPLPEGRLEGSQVVYEIGDFPSGSAFTAYVNMSLTPEEFDELTAPAGMEALIGGLDFQPGATYLVSAYDGVVSYCGLTGPATPELQAMYAAAFPA